MKSLRTVSSDEHGAARAANDTSVVNAEPQSLQAAGADVALAPNEPIDGKEPKGSFLLGIGAPFFMALSSLGMSTYTWYQELGQTWELSRPLAGMDLGASILEVADERSLLAVELKLSNVGELSYLLRDVKVEVRHSQGMSIAFSESSLIQTDSFSRPLGLKPFIVEPHSQTRSAEYRFDPEGSWHIVDRGRSVVIPFTLPLEGTGVVELRATAFLQAVTLMSSETDIAEKQLIAGVNYGVSPEFGHDSDPTKGAALSTEMLFPFTATAVLLVGSGTAELKVVREFSD